MGTDRFTIHRGSCLCGNGNFVVEYCEADHMYARGGWLESSIECAACEQKYELQEDGKDVVVVRKSDLARRRKLEEEYAAKREEFMSRADVRAILDDFAERLSAFPRATPSPTPWDRGGPMLTPPEPPGTFGGRSKSLCLSRAEELPQFEPSRSSM
jgi:hypothetical protein